LESRLKRLAAVFEDTSTGITPFAYFVDHAVLSPDGEEALLSLACKD
jgi:hypothetical protein